MNCPVCNIPLHEATRQDVPVAECSQCKGLWLNREALITIMRRTDQDIKTAARVHQPGSPSMKHARRDEDWVDYYPDQESGIPQSFLAEIFSDPSNAS